VVTTPVRFPVWFDNLPKQGGIGDTTLKISDL
jgi:hypothetical protein